MASPYLVTSDLTVEGDKALFIQAGVTLLFKPGTGFYVNSGSLTIAGNQAAPVVFRSAQEPATAGSWKGIFLTGEKEFYMFGANISDAEVGIAIEKGSLSLQASKISNTTSRGVYVRDAKASIMESDGGSQKIGATYKLTGVDAIDGYPADDAVVELTGVVKVDDNGISCYIEVAPDNLKTVG